MRCRPGFAGWFCGFSMFVGLGVRAGAFWVYFADSLVLGVWVPLVFDVSGGLI